ncbi:MAG TPA: hypothetical protein VMF07_11250 [Solirubrobacteraceae bacterium]|nr:hypothetical protein [Solirubrobacteraceae bacterium]
MAPDSLHDLFFAAAGVAGALIGLLFVAISVEHERLTARDADQVHRVRARSALSAFVNALVISLFALVPDDSLGVAATWAGSLGILFVLGSVLSVRRAQRHPPAKTGHVRQLTFLVLMLVTFSLQVVNGIRLLVHAHSQGAANWIAVLVIVCFMLGIYRSWELIGGPEIGFGHELAELVRERSRDPDTPEDRSD